MSAGDKIFVVGQDNNTVDEFALSTPWDLSTATHTQGFSVGAQDANMSGLFFKPDGMKMYTSGWGNNRVYEYDLSTPWDVSTASFLQSFLIGSPGVSVSGVAFKLDGTKMYVSDFNNDEIQEYDLSTPWDISTASFLQPFNVGAQDNGPQDVRFKPDGTKMYVEGDSSDSIHEYDLSTAWDVSTAVFNQSFSVSAQDTGPFALAFKQDGQKFYFGGGDNDRVYEYDMSTPWNISTSVFNQSLDVSLFATTVTGIFFEIEPIVTKLSGRFGATYDVQGVTFVRGRIGSTSDTEGRMKVSDKLGSTSDTLGAVKVTSKFGGEYSVFEATGGPKQLTSAYAIRIAEQLQVLYGARVSNQLLSVYHARVLDQHALAYNISPTVRRQLSADYGLLGVDPVVAQHAVTWAFSTQAQNDTVYSINIRVAKQHRTPITHISPVAKQHAVTYDLQLTARPITQHKAVYALHESTLTNITNQPSITFDGRVIPITEATVFIDEGSFVWQADINLADIQDFKRLKKQDVFDLDLGGETYKFMVVSKNLSRSAPAEIDISLTGKSPGVKHEFPFAQPITKIWDTDVTAKDAVEEILGEAVDWQLLDWLIPANRLGSTEGEPIRIAQSIVEAVGGVLESKPDGTLLARSLFPVAVPKIPGAVPDQIYLDVVDNLSVNEIFESTRILNKFRVSDVKGRLNDSLDFEFDTLEDGTKSVTAGTLKVFPNPFRTGVVVRHTQEGGIGLERVGLVTEQITELVEIKEGTARVARPIQSIDSVQWQSVDLGSLTFVQGDTQVSSTHATLKYSLVSVTYTTRFIKYRVTGVPNKNVQFILEGA